MTIALWGEAFLPSHPPLTSWVPLLFSSSSSPSPFTSLPFFSSSAPRGGPTLNSSYRIWGSSQIVSYAFLAVMSYLPLVLITASMVNFLYNSIHRWIRRIHSSRWFQVGFSAVSWLLTTASSSHTHSSLWWMMMWSLQFRRCSTFSLELLRYQSTTTTETAYKHSLNTELFPTVHATIP